MNTLDVLKEHLSNLISPYGHHLGLTPEEAAYFYIGPAEEVAPGVYIFYSLGNSTTFICDGGLMQVDCHTYQHAPGIIKAVRERTDLPFETITITHGHVDHCGGIFHYAKDNERRSYPQPRVIGSSTLRKRMDRYKMMEGSRRYTNTRQFRPVPSQTEKVSEPLDIMFVYPDTEFRDRLEITVGKDVFQLVFSGGHTDDAIWVYCRSRKVLCCGDEFQWGAPNLGNPYKVQRYAKESAEALEEMAACGAEVLCPGHGPVIYGKDEIKTCLLTVAHYNYHIQNHVVNCMNKGMFLEETINSLKMPDELLNSKWLRPLHGHPIFTARAIYHRYGGYYAGKPAGLIPPVYADISREVLSLANGTEAVITRAKELQAAGKIELACQVAEWAVEGDPQCKQGWELYGLLFKERAENEVNLQARGCWNTAVCNAVDALESLNDE